MLTVEINFSSNLKRFRTAKKISKTELARRIGVSDVTIYKWEKGETSPRMGKVELIAQVLDVTTDDLLFGPETIQPSKPDGLFSEIFSNLVGQSEYSEEELVKKLNTSQPTIERLKTGDLAPNLPQLKKIVKLFNIDPIIFFGGNCDKETAKNTFTHIDARESIEMPLYGAIPAGEPIEMLEAVDQIEVPLGVANQYPDAFFLEVTGDSMNKVVSHGSYALIDPCIEVSNGEIAAVVVNGFSVTLKRFYKLHNSVVLEPDSYNQEHSSKMYETNKDDSVTINIIGKMVWFMPPFDLKY